VRRPSVRKKDKRRDSKTKARCKFMDHHEEYMQTRYVLFYADDIVQQGIQTKSQVQYHQLLGENFDNSQVRLDEDFKQELRQEMGIFFDIDVRPTSPRKRGII
jgi:hypothetical protein